MQLLIMARVRYIDRNCQLFVTNSKKFESEKRIELLVYKTADLIWRAFFIRKFDWHLIGLIYKGVAKQPWHYIDPRSMLLEKKAVKSLQYIKKEQHKLLSHCLQIFYFQGRFLSQKKASLVCIKKLHSWKTIRR